MRFPPPEVQASWPEPNFENPKTRGLALIVVELTILPVALIVLSLRFFVRGFMLRRQISWDDWTMLAAAICAIGVTICVVLASQAYGWDIHVWDLTASQAVKGRQASIAAQTLFILASGLTKVSILLSYLRIAPKGSLFRRITYCALTVCALAIVIFFVVLWTQCLPMSSYWELLAPHRDCKPEGPPLMIQATITVVLDCIIYTIPMPTFYQLKLPLVQRIGLIVIFGFGSVVVVAGIMREYYIYYTVYETYDITWEGFSMWIWTAVEVNLGVICGSVPSLKPLFFRDRSRNASSYGHSHGASANVTADRRRTMRKPHADEEMDTLTGGITVKRDVRVDSTRKVPSWAESAFERAGGASSIASSIENNQTPWDNRIPAQGPP
ncbi:hypothetical protein P152DRAFT_469067 [Eremomyces bilateralis CBS 781.70]|uniref:Rhodopsin domain-containing protein n=1 Tax=Eremomyces bilateralis CBS 781.70 TaxID=1392243 RepID=A0A6G1FR82_9PEZI|nr:uncharacterized protein P152DRAFT_469067 [Eremomyces bilateralis CBS 781.70]KAF1808287.1 hypothetical protein P152DRAFT_469067 [Eremomyces bilateralis CBS 781.70]